MSKRKIGRVSYQLLHLCRKQDFLLLTGCPIMQVYYFYERRCFLKGASCDRIITLTTFHLKIGNTQENQMFLFFLHSF